MSYAEIVAINDMRQNAMTLAKGLDEAERKLDILRVRAGFRHDWSPYHNREQASGVSAAVRWSDKVGTVNGAGDLQRMLQEMATGLDMIMDKIEDVMAKLPAHESEHHAAPRKRSA